MHGADRVTARLSSAIDPDGPCREVNSDTAVRLADGGSAEPSGRLNVRFPDVMVRDCSEPYDAATVASGALLVVEITSEGTHRDALVLTQPVSLAVTFADLQRRLPRR
jgi:hypothetical protein